MTDELQLRVARLRRRAAEDSLYPALLADPGAYQRTVAAVQAVAAELRRRGASPEVLLAAEAAPLETVASAGVDTVPVAPELLVAAACSAVERETTAEREQARRAALVDAARAEGRAWAVVDGPADTDELTEGRSVAVHLASGTVVAASVDPWAREDAFGFEVSDGESRAYSDREAWRAGLAATRARIEAGASP